jgi:hypothetical protein
LSYTPTVAPFAATAAAMQALRRGAAGFRARFGAPAPPNWALHGA